MSAATCETPGPVHYVRRHCGGGGGGNLSTFVYEHFLPRWWRSENFYVDTTGGGGEVWKNVYFLNFSTWGGGGGLTHIWKST